MTDEGEDEDEVPAKKRKVSKATPKKTPKKVSKENKKVSKKIQKKKKSVTIKGDVKTAKKIVANEQVGFCVLYGVTCLVIASPDKRNFFLTDHKCIYYLGQQVKKMYFFSRSRMTAF